MTSVSGNLFYPVHWSGKSPALIRKYDNKVLPGEILEIDENGCVFDHNDDKITFDPDPKYFKWKDISCLIDSGGKVIYGSIPKYYNPVWDLELSVIRQDTVKSKPIKLKLDANRPFSFCLDPGLYKIESMLFTYSQQLRSGLKSTSLPEITFSVEDGFNNYIGDIYLDFYDRDAIEILCAEYLQPFISVSKGMSVGMSYSTYPIDKHNIKVVDGRMGASEDSKYKKGVLRITKD